MAAKWTWTKRHERWVPPDPYFGGTSTYSQPFTTDQSVQRVIVRFTPYAVFGSILMGAFKLPAPIAIKAELAIGTEFGPINYLATETTFAVMDYRRLSDTTPDTMQAYWATFRPVFWDITVRHKVASASPGVANVILTIDAQAAASTQDQYFQPLSMDGSIQFDCLFSGPLS